MLSLKSTSYHQINDFRPLRTKKTPILPELNNILNDFLNI